MDRLLSVSQAARMVGVPRRLLQQHIQEGRIDAFEGHVRVSELRKAYPEADSERSGMIEKVSRIREAAVFKTPTIPDPTWIIWRPNCNAPASKWRACRMNCRASECWRRDRRASVDPAGKIATLARR
ncbi:MAG: hypothetical protein H6962_08805 [Chromatiaceae bacterium]|nr:hypothetical protein [Chromatiaceae bacterium]